MPHSSSDLAAVIELRVLKKIEHASRCAVLCRGAAENDPFQARMNHCSGAHRAWFFGDEQFAFMKAPITNNAVRLCDSKHLRVGGGVFQFFDLVVGASDDPAPLNNDRPDRHLFPFPSSSCQA